MFSKSSKILTTSQKRLLSKGFKFVPSRRKVDIGKLIADITNLGEENATM
jgi:hypothetical protein